MDKTQILILLKIAVMIAFFLIVVVVGTLPIRSNTFKQRPILQAIGATFAGSLFLNVALMHILPQSADKLQQYMRGGEDKQVFPLAYLLLMVGFLITVFFTRVFGSHSQIHSHDHDVQGKQPFINNENSENSSQSQTSNKDAYLLTLAMYFHTIFEGIAIGVQNNIAGFLSTAVAIGFHKWADALSMGCHYRAKNVSKKIGFALIVIQAVLNVLSIGVGWFIVSEGQVVEAIFLSISSGTFLAISTLQLLGEQLHSRKYIIWKYLLMIGATAFVASIWFFQNAIFS